MAPTNTVRETTLEALVKYRFHHMRCSIDVTRRKPTRSTVCAVISTGSWRTIDKINAYKNQYGSEYPLLTWQFVVFGHNEHEIATARQMAQDRGMEFETKLNWDERRRCATGKRCASKWVSA